MCAVGATAVQRAMVAATAGRYRRMILPSSGCVMAIARSGQSSWQQ
jgi:hypothetical protein